MPTTSPHLLLRAFALALGGLVATAGAATKFWDGGAGDNRWGSNNNWAANGVPGPTDDVVFNNTYVSPLPATLELRGDRSALSLAFDTGNTVDLVNGNGNRTLDLHGSAGLTRSAGSSGTQSLSFKNLDLQTDTTFEIGGTGRLVVASTIRDGGGSRALARTGAGTLVLSGDNTFSGGLSLSSGLTLLGHDNGAGAGTLTFAGGALGGGDAARTVANPLEASGTVILSGDQDLTLTGAFSLGTGDRTLQVENSALTTISGVISNNSSATTTKTGSGTLVLAGAAANTFAGSVAVAAGTLELAKSSGTAALAGDADVTGEGTLRLGADHQMVDTATVTLGAGTAPTFAVAGRTETIGHLVSANPTSVVDLGGGALTVGANDASGTLAGSIAGSGTFVKAGTGTLALTGSFTGAASATVSAGTLLAGADAILGAANALTVAAGATFDLASYSAAVATLAGAGTLQLGSGAVLAVGAGGDSSTFGGQLAGSGRLDKLGTGSLTFTADFSFAGELRLGDGTVVLSGVDLAVGTLRVTGNTVLDFGSSAASTLTATHVTIDPGATLTIVNWIDLQDFFFATGSFQQFGGPSAAFDTRGTAPQNQLVFSGWSANDTSWISWDRQISPTPEPAAAGALLTAASLAFLAWRRRRSSAAA